MAPHSARPNGPPGTWRLMIPTISSSSERRCPHRVSAGQTNPLEISPDYRDPSHNSYRAKKPHERASIHHDSPPTIRVHTLTPRAA
jgi:hypothetical protein